MAGEPGADQLAAFRVGDHVIELQLDPLAFAGPGEDVHGIVVVKGPEVVQTGGDDRIGEAALLDLPVGIGGLAHQRGPAELEVAQVVGMVDHLGAVRVGIQGAQFAAVPGKAAGGVAEECSLFVDGLGDERFGPHLTLP
ncbi:hypothetical protein DESC_10047 [Desulfosarcina cetonica]|nr:hypothetical protein DESC_10047 [Desulfosarcina cetonica]